MDFLSKKKKPNYDDHLERYEESNQNLIRIDLVDDDDRYYLYADVPGKKISDIKLKFKGDNLSIRVVEETEINNPILKKSCIIQERLHDEYERLIQFEDPIDKKSVSAKLENGVLIVTITKIDPEKEDESDLIKITI